MVQRTDYHPRYLGEEGLRKGERGGEVEELV